MKKTISFPNSRPSRINREFFVGVYTKDDYKYFSDDSGSFWKVYLTAENGDRVDPVSISKVK